MNKIFNRYAWNARIFPTIILLVPIWIFVWKFWGIDIEKLGSILTQSVFGLAILLLSSEFLTRNLGKKLENKVFENGKLFPTTCWLQKENSELSEQKKKRIYDKIKEDFKIDLKNSTAKDIKDAVSQIRLKVGNGKLLLQYNERYGAWRNFSASSIYSAMLSLLLGVYFYFSDAKIIWIILFIGLIILFGAAFYFRKKILLFCADEYAEQLFNEYLSQ